MLKLRPDQFLSLLVIALFLLLQGAIAANSSQTTTPKLAVELVDVAPVPVRNATNSAQLKQENQQLDTIIAQAFYATDIPSASVLAEKASDQLLYPASTVKMMTALVARDLYQAGQVLTVNTTAYNEGNGMSLRKGEEITVEVLLSGLLISSDNNAAYVLANNHPDGLEGFLLAMKAKAVELKLNSIDFSNPSGFDSQTQLTTARDLTLLAREILKNSVFKSLVGTQRTTVTDVTGQIKHLLTNTNHLLGDVAGVNGLKTGTTLMAGEVLISSVERDGHQVIVIVMGSPSRYQETEKLIEWVYANYHWESVERLE